MLSRFGTSDCIWDALQQSQQSPELSPSDFLANSDIISKDETDSGRPSEGGSSKRSSGADPSFPHSRCVAPISAKCAWEAMRKDELYCPHCLGTFRRLEGLMEHVRIFKPCRDKWDGDCVMIGCDTCHKKVQGGVALVVREYQEHYNPAFGFECPGCHDSENRFRSVLRHIESPGGQFDCGNLRAFNYDRYSCPDCSFTCVGRLPFFAHKQECEARPPGHRRMGMLGRKFPTIFKGWCAHCGARFGCDLDEWRHHQVSPECFEACSSEPATLRCLNCSDGARYNSSQFWAHLCGGEIGCAICYGAGSMEMDPVRAITIARANSIGELPNISVREAPLLPQHMQALWTALVGKKHTDEVMDTICDQLERRSHRDEGWMGRRFAVGIDSGATPIILASLASRPDVVAALINRGADVGAATDSDVGRFTALHAASEYGLWSFIAFVV